MMYIQGYLQSGINGIDELPDPAWVAGAKAGLNEAFYRVTKTDWRDFFESLEDLFRFMLEVQPAEPGTTPKDGSLYETLGGYVSVVGRVTSQGLSFSLPPIRQQAVVSLFPGMDLYRNGKEVLVPHEELDSFKKLVPLRGPIEEMVSR
jgi:hypothetical protein